MDVNRGILNKLRLYITRYSGYGEIDDNREILIKLLGRPETGKLT